jgi:peroxiredoxin
MTNTIQQKIDILTLNRLKIINERNEEIVLSSLWKDHPAVIVFIRHFGCISCRSHIDQVWSKKDKIESNGTKIYFIGSGSPYLISQFKKDCNITEARIFTDQTLESFKASGLIHTNTKVLDASSLKKIKELEAMGYSLKKIENDGDDTQLGGIVAMKPPGIVGFHFISQYIGDFEDKKIWDQK